MKLGLGPLVLAAALCGSMFACAKSINTGLPGGELADGGDAGKTEDGSAESPDDPPHALGIIRLAETHVAGSSSASTPAVSAAFMPTSETAAEKVCGTEVDGCTIVAKADCGGDIDAGTTGCELDEVCTLDENCESVCKPIPSCSPSCDTEEVCQLVGTRSKCVPKIEFNAGVITLSGDGVSKTFTLRPPYSVSPTGDSPFVPESEIKVSASGAADTGYDKFTDTFTSTMFIETTPALHKLDPAVVFEESGAVPIGWKPGADEIKITLTSNAGTAICKGDDASGEFEITRKVIGKIYDEDTSSFSSPTLTISVARTKTKVKKDAKTIGTIDGVDLPPVGFVRFSTESIETHTVQGCSSGYKSCPSTTGTTRSCTNIMTDSYNCGDCGVKCLTSEYCSSGQCI